MRNNDAFASRDMMTNQITKAPKKVVLNKEAFCWGERVSPIYQPRPFSAGLDKTPVPLVAATVLPLPLPVLVPV